MKRPFHQTCAPIICNHDPQTWGSVGDIRANEPLFYFDIDFDELNIPRQTWQCILKHTRLRGGGGGGGG